MKTKAYKIKRGIALCGLVFMALFITLNMNACGSKDKKGGGGDPVAPPPTSCPGCAPGGVANLGSALGQNPEIVLGLNFSSLQEPTNNGGTYNGPVTASGFLHIKASFSCAAGVVLPAGIFAATTVQQGQWAGAWGSSLVRQLVMQANGIQFVVGPGGFYTDGIINGIQPHRTGPNGEQYPNYLAGDVQIQSVNGTQCNVFGPLIESIN